MQFGATLLSILPEALAGPHSEHWRNICFQHGTGKSTDFEIHQSMLFLLTMPAPRKTCEPEPNLLEFISV